MTVLLSRVRGLFVDATPTRKVSLIYYLFSLKKRDKSVGNVGNVGKSEKSPENFPRKVSQNAYIAYTTYIGWGLEVDYRLDTLPLHEA